jgi:hypothetical protein
MALVAAAGNGSWLSSGDGEMTEPRKPIRRVTGVDARSAASLDQVRVADVVTDNVVIIDPDKPVIDVAACVDERCAERRSVDNGRNHDEPRT